MLKFVFTDNRPKAYKLRLAGELTKSHRVFRGDDILEEDEKVLERGGVDFISG